MKFEEALEFGTDGERAVAQKLISRGVIVSPLYQYTNHDKAPVLLYETDGELVSSILPDLSCWKNGRGYFAEVKRKNRWIYWDGRVETGFNQRLYDQYLEISRKTSFPIYVFFIHETRDPTGVFYQELSKLSRTLRRWDGRKPNGERVVSPEALFDFECLIKAWDLSEVGLTEAA